jgi:hypothetical protein
MSPLRAFWADLLRPLPDVSGDVEN